MPTVVTPPRRHSRELDTDDNGALAETRFMVSGATWELYDRLSDAIPRGQGLRLAFDGKDLEIMVVGPLHEGTGSSLRLCTYEICFGLEIDFRDLGATTWKRPEIQRGIESDICFYFDQEKVQAVTALIAHRSNQVADYPNPDLVIEIDISPPKVDRAGIYRSLHVPEIWRFEDEAIVIEQLVAEKYIKAISSRFLSIRPDEILRWAVTEASANRVQWRRNLHAWVQAELKPRYEVDHP